MSECKVQSNLDVFLITLDDNKSRRLEQHEWCDYDLSHNINSNPCYYSQQKIPNVNLSNSNGKTVKFELGKHDLVKSIILDDFPKDSYQLILNGIPVLTSKDNVFIIGRNKSTMLDVFMDIHETDDCLDLSKFDNIKIVGNKYPSDFFNHIRTVKIRNNRDEVITEHVKPNSTSRLCFNYAVPYVVIDSFDVGSIKSIAIKSKGDIIFKHDIDSEADKIVLNFDFADYCRKHLRTLIERKTHFAYGEDYYNNIESYGIKFIDFSMLDLLGIMFEINSDTKVTFSAMTIECNEKIDEVFGIPKTRPMKPKL